MDELWGTEGESFERGVLRTTRRPTVAKRTPTDSVQR